MSQPDRSSLQRLAEDDEGATVEHSAVEGVSFSQPVQPHHMLLGSQLNCTPGSSLVRETLQTFIVVVDLFWR